MIRQFSVLKINKIKLFKIQRYIVTFPQRLTNWMFFFGMFEFAPPPFNFRKRCCVSILINFPSLNGVFKSIQSSKGTILKQLYFKVCNIQFFCKIRNDSVMERILNNRIRAVECFGELRLNYKTPIVTINIFLCDWECGVFQKDMTYRQQDMFLPSWNKTHSKWSLPTYFKGQQK